MNKVVRLGLIFAVLFVAPFFAWYYLELGFNYQKSVRDELIDFGQLDSTLFEATRDSSIFLLGFDSEVETIQKLNKQFYTTGNFQLILLDTALAPVLGEEPVTIQKEAERIKKQLEPTFNSRKGNDLNQLFPLDESSFAKQDYFALVDTSFVVKGFYQASKPEQIKRMVEHIAILLPYKYKRRGE